MEVKRASQTRPDVGRRPRREPDADDDATEMEAAPAARAGLLGLTCLTLAGLFTLNTKGEGITRTAKRLWKAPEKEKA